MTTTDHKVLVTFEADAAQLKSAMGQVTKDLKKLHTQTGSVQKKDLKYVKENQKITEKQNRIAKTALPTQIKQIRQVSKELQQQNKILVQQLDLYKKINVELRRGVPRREARAIAGVARTGRDGGPAGRGGRGAGRGGRGANRPGGVPEGETVESDALFGGRTFQNLALAATKGLAKAALGVAVSAIAGLVAMPFAAIGEQYDAFRAYSSKLPQLAGYVGTGLNIGYVDDRETGDLANLRRGSAAALGFNPEEVISIVAATLRATGGERTGPVTGGAESAMAFSRLLGLDPSQMATMFGTMRQAGMTGFAAGGEGYKALTKAVSLGIFSGLEKARLPEFLQGVMSLTEAAAGREAGDVAMEPFARLLAQLGRTGLSGLQGERGANVARALEEGFTRPGGGEEGMALALSSMGFGRLGPGGGTDYYTARRNLELGTTAENPQFIQDMIRTINSAYGGNRKESNMAIQSMLGGSLTLAQIEAVQAAMARGEEPGEVSAMLESMTESERDILADIRNLLSGNPEVLRMAARNAQIQNENTDLGSQTAEALHEIQNMFRQFVADTMPAVRTVLSEISASLRTLTPILEGLSTVMNVLSMAFSLRRGDPSAPVRVAAAASGTELPPGADEYLRDLDRRAAAGLPTTAGSTGAASLPTTAGSTGAAGRPTTAGIPAMPPVSESAARSLAAWLNAHAGTRESGERASARLESVLAGLESRLTLLRDQGVENAPSIGRRIDTRDELNTVLAFLVANNVQVSPSIRALLDRRGGTE